MSNTVVIFSMSGCIHCKSLKNRLNDLSIPYIDIDIDRNVDLWKSVTNQTKLNVTPTIFIKQDGTDDGPVYVPTRDYQQEDEIIEIIKSHQ